jgi:putative cardiolipin synthase
MTDLLPARCRALLLLAAAALALLTGCATPLPRVDRAAIESSALPGDASTPLGRIVAASTPEGQHSGFRLMPLGPFSYDTRLQLARLATVSLDLQYYHFEGDETGRTLLRALRDAALRGVRVRLLIDDLYTGGLDDLFTGFAAHPNIEVRLFNPFCCARGSGQPGRFAAATGDWARVNHRMHNKMFIADGVAAIIGGRNIANEYFLRSEADNFIDMDAFAVGQLIEPLAALFDRYWNSDPVYPLLSVARPGLAPAQAMAYFERATGPAQTPPPAPLPSNDILGYGPLRDDLQDGRLGLLWGEAYAFADHPDKPFDGSVGGDLLETSVTYNIIEPMMKARNEVVISSPYFVPGAKGMALLRQLRERGVKISVMTNSLGSTDEPVVHIGYSRYREAMLRLGIELFEVSGTRVKQNHRMFHFGESLGRLHAKLLVIDRQVVFIGSMNFDPRSATINTELGAIIESKPLARELGRVIDLDRFQSAWQVRLSPQGTLEWVGVDGTGATDEMQVMTSEPDATPWNRLKLWLLAPLVSDDLL